MAYEYLSPEEKEKRQQAAATAPASRPTPGATLAPAGLPAQAAAPTSPVPGQGGSGFINFDRIINANKDNTKAQADKLAGSMQQQAQAAGSALTGVTNNFNASVAAGTPQAPPKTYSSIDEMEADRRNAPAAPPPSVTTQSAASPIKTPEEQLAAANYAGPTDITQSDDFNNMWSQIGKSDRRLGLIGTDAGMEALHKNQFGAGPGTGVTRQEAALLGAVAGDQFRDVKNAYGDQAAKVDKAVAASRDTVKTAQGLSADAKKYWEDRITGDAKAKSDKDAFNQGVADDALRKANQITGTGKDVSGKETNYHDYVTTNNFESTVRDIGEALDPTAWVLKATGNKTIEEMRTPNYEGSTGGNSNKVRFNQRLPMATEMELAQLYSGMTQAELSALENMPRRAQDEWLRDRYVKMKQGN